MIRLSYVVIQLQYQVLQLLNRWERIVQQSSLLIYRVMWIISAFN